MATSRKHHRPSYPILPLRALLLLALVHVVHGAPRQAIIDDEFGDSLTGVKPQFLPTSPGVWEGEECAGCRVKPDAQFANNRTYNAATYRPEAGTALQVFLTLANNCGEGVTTLTETNFTVDNEPPVFFRYTPDMSRTDYIYQYPAFNWTGREHRTHTFSATTSGPSYHIFLNFDYAKYTYDDALIPSQSTFSSSPPSPSSPTSDNPSSGKDRDKDQDKDGDGNGDSTAIGPIVGGVIGGVVILGLFFAAIFFLRRKHQQASNPTSKEYYYPEHGQVPGGVVQFTGHQHQHQGGDWNQETPPYMYHGVMSNASSEVGGGAGTVMASVAGTGTATGTSSSGSAAVHVHPWRNAPPRMLGDLNNSSARGHLHIPRSIRKGHGRRAGGHTHARTDTTESSSGVTTQSIPIHDHTIQPTNVNQGGYAYPTGTGAPALIQPPTSPNPHQYPQPQPYQSQAIRDLDARVQALQDSINAVLADIQAEEREAQAMARKGLTETLRNGGDSGVDDSESAAAAARMEGMRGRLRGMAEEMSAVQAQRALGGLGLRGDGADRHEEEEDGRVSGLRSSGGVGEDLPAYESLPAPSRILGS